jgi:hypothetical protein
MSTIPNVLENIKLVIPVMAGSAVVLSATSKESVVPSCATDFLFE